MGPRRLGLALGSALLLASTAAKAAPDWVDRTITLPAGHWAFDVGAGVAHVSNPEEDTSAGMNFEMAVGLTDRIELGVRTGVRFGDDFDRGLHPDEYGRLFDREYVGGVDEVLANPELRVRGALVRGPVLELGLEGRFVAPFEANSEPALEFGVPIALHLGNRVRFDTGVWVPILFNYGAPVGVSVPFDLWIQVTRRLWLGPMTGIDVVPMPYGPTVTDVSMGFGLGFQITRFLDFKAMFLFPELNQDGNVFGFGAGLQIRIE
jgi:hypothetical protein